MSLGLVERANRVGAHWKTRGKPSEGGIAS
jgi:hypothetical protein